MSKSVQDSKLSAVCRPWGGGGGGGGCTPTAYDQINIILKSNYLNEKGLITDQTEVANTFNKNFGNVAESLTKQITNKNTKYQGYLKNPNKCKLFKRNNSRRKKHYNEKQ